MKIVKILNTCSSLSIALMLVNNVYAFGLSDLTGAAETLEAGQAATTAVPSAATVAAPSAAIPAVPSTATANSLTGLLMQQLGVTQPQAEGGAGTLFQLAKSKMEGAAFSELSNSVPGMQGLLAAAPAAKSAGSSVGGLVGNLEGMAGHSGGTVGNLVGLTSSFQQLGLSPGMVQKFIPVVVQYVQGNGGAAVASVLQSALTGGL